MATGGSADADMAAGGSADADICTKRRAEGNEAAEENGIAAKNIKLEDSNDDQPTPSLSSSGSGSSANDSISSSQHSVSSSLPSGRAESQNGTTGVQSPSTSPEKNCWELALTKERLFNQFIQAFLKTNPPGRITYDGKKYNLTEAYEEFWKTLFDMPEYTSGYSIKLINNNLKHDKLLAIARVLKRGWEDERFFPKHLAQPLLEACLFNREDIDEIEFKPSILYKYIEPVDLEIIRNADNVVDNESLEVFKKYCPKTAVSLGDKMNSACIEVLQKIMYEDVKNIRHIWSPELVDLLSYEQFIFSMKKQPTISETEEYDVLTVAPHRLWGTFFYRWNAKMIDFYLKLLPMNSSFESCSFCSSSDVSAKHILSVCESKLMKKMLKERNECALRKIVQKVKEALNHSNYFSRSKYWKLHVMNQNLRTLWPEELNFVSDLRLFPDIVVWTTHKKKMALVMEVTVSWDYWINGSLYYDQTEKYSGFVEALRCHGYEADFRDIKLGSRGVFSSDLYNVFDEICGMAHPEISKTMEEINKEIIEVAFNFQYANE